MFVSYASVALTRSVGPWAASHTSELWKSVEDLQTRALNEEESLQDTSTNKKSSHNNPGQSFFLSSLSNNIGIVSFRKCSIYDQKNVD